MLNVLMTSSGSMVKVTLAHTDHVAQRWTSGRQINLLMLTLLTLARILDPRDALAQIAEMVLIETMDFVIKMVVILIHSELDSKIFMVQALNTKLIQQNHLLL